MDIERILTLPENEKTQFKVFIKKYREKYIRKPSVIVEETFLKEDGFKEELTEKRSASHLLERVREIGWQQFQKEESLFNTAVLTEMNDEFALPKQILGGLIDRDILGKQGDELRNAVRKMCGDYFGRIYPFIYELSLSNTNSRRSRAGSTFEAIIYKFYDLLDYPYDSQRKVGRRIFSDVGFGKKVDSVLPSIDAFEKMRTKTIIGTMKTSLRERWQEVAEEIERTKIPQIHLLTVDEDISSSKAEEMNKHNIIIVALKEVSQAAGCRNIISFEDYFFKEIPQVLDYWELS